jgi:hypothetical protein
LELAFSKGCHSSERQDSHGLYTFAHDVLSDCTLMHRIQQRGDCRPSGESAHQRAAAKVRTLPESIDELVREGANLTAYAVRTDAFSGLIPVRTGWIFRRRMPGSLTRRG